MTASTPATNLFSPTEKDKRLVAAASGGLLDEVRRLLSEGADPNAVKGHNALDRAADNGHVDVCIELLLSGAREQDAHRTMADYAVSYTPPDIQLVTLAVAAGADLSEAHKAARRHKRFQAALQATPLAAATRLKDVRLVALVLERHPDIDDDQVREAAAKTKRGSIQTLLKAWLARREALRAVAEIGAAALHPAG